MTNAKVDWYANDLLAEISGQSTDALYEGGLKLMEEARAKAPERTGRLRKSGYVSSVNKSTYRQRKGDKKERRPTKDGIVAVAFAARYSHLVEFGTKKAKAKPFLRPALDNFKAAIGSAIVVAWRTRLSK